MSFQSQARLITGLWIAYLLLLPWHRVWQLPLLGTAVQPPEIVFIALFGIAIIASRPHDESRRLGLADAGAIGWLLANALSLAWSGNSSAVSRLETVGAAYLVAMYAVVRLTATPARVNRFAEWFGYSVAIAALVGVIGSVKAAGAGVTPLASASVTPVAYLGRAARAQALTAGPQMLASLTLLAIPLFVGARLDRRWRHIDTVVVLILIGGMAATLSKSALALPAVMAVMWACGPRSTRANAGWRLAATVLAIGAAVSLSIGTMFMVVRASAVPFVTAVQFAAGEPVREFTWRSEPWAMVRTTYYFNHLASVRAVEETFPRGVGPKGQPAFAATLARTGRYPASIQTPGLMAPHSTYLGVPAELGLAGVAALLLLIAGAVVAIRRLLHQPLVRSWEVAAYAGAGVGFCLEALSTDLMNCRHYWWLLAIVTSRAAYATAGRRRRMTATSTNSAASSIQNTNGIVGTTLTAVSTTSLPDPPA